MSMSYSDKVAVIEANCSDLIASMRVPRSTVEEVKDMVNDFLQSQGWSRFATRSMILSVAGNVRRDAASTTTQPPQEAKTVSIEYRTLINGNNADHMSVESYLGAIKDVDAEIERLTRLNVESVVVKKTLERLNADRATLVKLLDEKHGEDDNAG